MLETLKDLFGYMKVHKKFWLAPVILLLLLLRMKVLLARLMIGIR